MFYKKKIFFTGFSPVTIFWYTLTATWDLLISRAKLRGGQVILLEEAIHLLNQLELRKFSHLIINMTDFWVDIQYDCVLSLLSTWLISESVMLIIKWLNFLNSNWFRRCIASSYRITCPPRNFVREINKSHVAVSVYQNIVTVENQ
jgi:hypothetical protein